MRLPERHHVEQYREMKDKEKTDVANTVLKYIGGTEYTIEGLTVNTLEEWEKYIWKNGGKGELKKRRRK